MTSKTETARLACLAALVAAAGEEGSSLPSTIWRNEPLARAFDEGADVFVNLVDGDIEPLDEELGEDDADEGELEFEVPLRLELVVRGRDPAAREALFDAVLVEIRDALFADRTLSGACDWLRLGRPQLANLSLTGIPAMKAGEMVVRLLLTAEDYIG